MPTSLVSEVKTQSIDRFKDMRNLKDFDILRKLGKGTFGIVQKARYIKTGQVVALKQLINHSAKEGFPITAMREITIVKSLNHKNILKILDMIYEEPKVTNPQELIHTRGCFHTVSPYMTSDLVGLLENPNIVLTLSQIKCFMQQLLTGIQYIHEKKYLHRDIKAANILIDENGVLKIADFGLARIYHGTAPTLGNGPGGGERSYTGLVVTRWYRPPEILLGERKYTTAVDIWGVGCVFGEFFTGKPILSGRSDSHQCQIVFQMVGPPKSDDWPDINTLPNKTDINIGLTCKRSLEEKFMPLMNDALGVDLLSKMLTLNPYKRCNALDALNHPFFKSDPLPDKPHELPKFEECHEIDKERFQKMAKNKGLINVSQETTSTKSSTSMKDLKTPGAPLPNQGGTNNSLPNSKRSNNFAANYSDSGFRPESNRDLSRSASEGTESNVWGTNNDANSDTSSFKSNLEEVNKSNTLNRTSDVQQSGNKEADHGNNVNKLEVLSSIDNKPTMTEQKATTNVVKELTPLNSTRLPSRDNVKPPTSSIFMPKNKKRPAPPPSAVISSKKKVIKPSELDGSNAMPTKLIPLSNTTPKFNPITKTKQDNLHSKTHSGAEDDDLSEYEDEVPNKYIINKVGLEDYQKLFK